MGALKVFGVAAVATTLVLAPCAARADFTYVDADATEGTGNTTPSSAFLAGSNNQADDDLWSLRTGFASGGTVYQSGDGDGEDAPEITTLLSGLTPGAPYTVYVNFWDGSGADPDWNVRAGFASGDTTLFANGVDSDADDLGAVGAALASDLTYSSPPTVFVEADRTMFAGRVGTTLADGNGEIAVYVDDLPSTIGVNNRSWYDGVSYQLVPEPSSLMLLLAGSGVCAARRRNA